MNTAFFLAAAIAFCLTFQARADDSNGKQAPTKVQTAKSSTEKTSAKSERSLWTGSLIPRKLQKNGMITDGTAPLVVIDRDAIERSGASTVMGVMRHYH